LQNIQIWPDAGLRLPILKNYLRGRCIVAKGKGKRLESKLKAKQQKGLTPKQRRKLPLALRKAILKKKGKR